MTATQPNQPDHPDDDATNQGVSTPEPVEGSDDAPAGDGGSPTG
jgi:hypothetical protein